MGIFKAIVQGLESRGAFEDVPVPQGVVLPMEFESLKPAGNPPFSTKWVIYRYGEVVPQGVADYNFQNIRAAMDAYMPQDDFMPWSREFAAKTLTAPLPDIMCELMKIRVKDTQDQVLYYRKRQTQTSTHPGLKGLANTQKHELNSYEIAVDVVQKHPVLVVALTVFQASHLEFISRVAHEVQRDNTLLPEQKAIAEKALQVLSRLFSTGNFVSPLVGIAGAYHQRVNGDHRKPLEADDFVKGWEALFHGHGFISHMTNDDKSEIEVRCPFKARATTASVRIAGNEICAADRHALRQSMGYGIWCLYQAARNGNCASARLSQARAAIKAGMRFADEDVNIEEKPYEARVVSIMSGQINAHAQAQSRPLGSNDNSFVRRMSGFLRKYLPKL